MNRVRWIVVLLVLLGAGQGLVAEPGSSGRRPPASCSAALANLTRLCRGRPVGAEGNPREATECGCARLRYLVFHDRIGQQARLAARRLGRPAGDSFVGRGAGPWALVRTGSQAEDLVRDAEDNDRRAVGCLPPLWSRSALDFRATTPDWLGSHGHGISQGASRQPPVAPPRVHQKRF